VELGGARRASRGRVLRTIGVLFLAGAVAAAGYLGWLLWGTGIITERHQRELRQVLEPKLAHPVPPPKPSEEPVHLPGDAIAIIEIPRIDLDMVVVEGVDTASLTEGPGHYPDTAYPWQNRGRVAIAGHRTTYLRPFWSLDKMRDGDPIVLRTEYGTFRYQVSRVFVTSPYDGSVLDQTRQPTLVLTTCNPRFSASERLIVVAERVAAITPTR